MRLWIFYIAVITAILTFFLTSSCSTTQKRTDSFEKAQEEARKAESALDEDTEGADVEAKSEQPILKEETEKGGIKKEEITFKKGKKPQWVKSKGMVVSEGYYIGVGHAPDTGNPTEDKKRARMNAYDELASEISITIQSETTVTATEDTEGKHYESVEVQIKSLVSQNLEQVEPVDAWYSKRDGYWYYCNLSKEKWDHIQNREKYSLRDRVLVMVEPVLKSSSESIADKIKILSKGIDMVKDSGFAGQIEADLMGEKGFLFDLMKRKRERLV